MGTPSEQHSLEPQQLTGSQEEQQTNYDFKPQGFMLFRHTTVDGQDRNGTRPRMHIAATKSKTTCHWLQGKTEEPEETTVKSRWTISKSSQGAAEHDTGSQKTENN